MSTWAMCHKRIQCHTYVRDRVAYAGCLAELGKLRAPATSKSWDWTEDHFFVCCTLRDGIRSSSPAVLTKIAIDFYANDISKQTRRDSETAGPCPDIAERRISCE